MFGQFRLNHIRCSNNRSRSRDHSMYDGASEIYNHLSSVLGNQVTQEMILAAIVEKIVNNLKCEFTHPNVIKESLHLLHNIASGYSSVQVLCSCEVAKSLLLNHGCEHFPFMLQTENLKQRSLFYEILTIILMQDQFLELFDEFMKPFENIFEQLENVQDFTSRDVILTGVGLARDLNGCLLALTNSRAYLAFFNWIYPRYFRIILRMFEPWWENSFVCIPMLKFISSFTHQKYQRIDFPISSPNGILLFREISKVLVTYGNRVLVSPEDNYDDPYKQRYKGIMVCMIILHRSLSGQFVNFGMFEIYDDPSLRESIMVVVNLVRKFRYEVLMSYTKISRHWWRLLELLFRQHFEILALDEEAFDYLFRSLFEGVQSQHTTHSSPVLHAIDHIFSWVYNKSLVTKRKPKCLEQIQNYMQNNHDYILQLLTCLLNIHFFDTETTNTWAHCRPIYSIISVFPDMWNMYLQKMLPFQQESSRELITENFMLIVQDMDTVISDKNRETFVKKLAHFKTDYRNIMRKWEP